MSDNLIYQILSAVSGLGVVFIAAVIYQVLTVTKYKLTEIAFILMLVALLTSLLFNIAFFQCLCYFMNRAKEEKDFPFTAYCCSLATTNYLPQLFLAIATMINLNKWLYFSERVRVQAPQFGDSPRRTSLKKGYYCLNLFTVCWAIFLSAFYIHYMRLGCSGKYDTVEKLRDFYEEVQLPETNLTVGVFVFLSICFLAAAILLTLRLKQNHIQFYNDHKTVLWLTTFLLTVPLLVRSLFDSLNRNQSWDKFWAGKLVVYNTLFFLIVDLVPILCQTGTLVFGVIRYRQVSTNIEDNDSENSFQIKPTSEKSSIVLIFDDSASFFEPPLEQYMTHPQASNQQGAQFEIRRVTDEYLVIGKKNSRTSSSQGSLNKDSLNRDSCLLRGEMPDDYGQFEMDLSNKNMPANSMSSNNWLKEGNSVGSGISGDYRY